MSYNPSFYSNVQPHFTFQRPNFVPPPPLPPAFYIPPIRSQITDQEFAKYFDKVSNKSSKYKVHPKFSINQCKEKLRNIIIDFNNIKEKERSLKGTISEQDWASKVAEIKNSIAQVNNSIGKINDSYLDGLRKLLAKRCAKRLRLKRIREEMKKEKQNRIKELKERSRKIDENLQKIKDDINKAKQEEEEKLQADVVLKETLRKKHDARKCITKLEALLRLYKARQNTAKGRGETVSERDAAIFSKNIEKLKSLWVQKLQLYEKEDSELRAMLKQKNIPDPATNKDAAVVDNLDRWRHFLFGGKEGPQRDFRGDIGGFVAVRSQWDQCASSEGTSLPIGWVLPNLKDN